MTDEIRPGQAIGHYEIVRLLGRGGMGEVWEAKDGKLGRRVALKILPAELVQNQGRRERFDREARAIAALQHPNIVTVYSIEEDEGRPYLVMELVEGRPLHELIPSGGMELERFLDIGVQIAEALAAAHGRNITHRDLKPANVLVDNEGRVRILDFGLAKWAEESTVDAETLHASHSPKDSLTGEGQIVGTVAYMSPEQAEGKPVDHRSDIFSLGVVLYQMATGRRPFEGESGMSLISSILRDDPDSISDVRPAYPRHAGRIVRRCLQKDPSRRYQTVLDLRNDLLELREDLDSGVLDVAGGELAPRGRSSTWMVWGALAILLVALVVAGVVLGKRGDADGPRKNVRRLLTQGIPGQAVISPDGRYVAYESLDGEMESLRLLQVSTGSDIELVPNSRWDQFFESLAFSRDGDYLYYTTSFGTASFSLFRVPTLGGPPRKLLDRVVSGGVVSPDGNWIAAVRGDDATGNYRVLEIVSSDGEETRLHHEIDEGRMERLTWSANGERLLVSIGTLPEVGPSIVSIGADDGTVERLAEPGTFSYIATLCTPSSRKELLVAGERNNVPGVWSFDPETKRVDLVHGDYQEYSGCSTTSSDDAMVTIRHGVRSQLWLVDPDASGEPERVRTTSGYSDGAEGLSWLNDRELVYTAPDERTYQVWRVDVEEGVSRKLTSNGAVEPKGAGDAMTYGGEWFGSGWGIYALEGDQEIRRLSSEGKMTFPPASRSRDGSWVIHAEQTANGMRLVRRPWEGGEPIVVYEGAAHQADFSPDGTRFTSHVAAPDGEWKTAIIPSDFSDPIAYLDVHSESVSPWASNDSIYIARSVDGAQNIYEVSIDTLEERQVTHFNGEEIFTFAVSPDLTRIAVAKGQRDNELLLVENR